MRWVAVTAVSLVVHGAILASLPSRDRPPPPSPPPPAVVELSPAPTPDPVAIELVPIPPTPPPVAVPEPGTGARHPFRAAPEPGTGARHPFPDTPEVAVPAPGTGALSMRDRAPSGETARARPDIPVPVHRGKYADLAERVLAMAPQERPPPPATSAELVAEKDGTYTKYDSVYTATVNPDGTVDFDDKANFNVQFDADPRKIAKAVGGRVAGWAEDPYGVATGANKKKRHEGPNAEDDDGDGKADEGETVTILSGGFDVTDAVMRWMGDDPYNAKKAAFLDRSRDARVEIGKQHRAKLLDASEQTIVAHLAKLWRRADLSAAARREGVFELWDDCEEVGEAAIVEAGARARAALYRFIGVHLPAGSADAFTDDELARLNAGRRSTARFSPYD